jgi:hypothetical protein
VVFEIMLSNLIYSTLCVCLNMLYYRAQTVSAVSKPLIITNIERDVPLFFNILCISATILFTALSVHVILFNSGCSHARVRVSIYFRYGLNLVALIAIRAMIIHHWPIYGFEHMSTYLGYDFLGHHQTIRWQIIWQVLYSHYIWYTVCMSTDIKDTHNWWYIYHICSYILITFEGSTFLNRWIIIFIPSGHILKCLEYK